jgi:ABC-type multidrug transport system fused ATPase/permease subunit
MALLGPSGSGKTTIMKLILGLCRPQAGVISIAGHDASHLAPTELRRLTACVPQEPWLFPGTVRANIALGNVAATDEAIIAAAQAAHAHDFVMRLPQGYDTLLDERGTNLSGGERQRLCLARALLKDAPVLLLDEATSAVDAESERLIRRAVDELGRRRTVVTVSHTDEMNRDADVVVALA